MIRGIRAVSDYEYELQQATANMVVMNVLYSLSAYPFGKLSDGMAVTDRAGILLAHSEPQKVGQSLYSREVVQALGVGEKSRWRTTESTAGASVFEVYRTFSPLPGFHRHMWHGLPHRRKPDPEQACLAERYYQPGFQSCATDA